MELERELERERERERELEREQERERERELEREQEQEQERERELEREQELEQELERMTSPQDDSGRQFRERWIDESFNYSYRDLSDYMLEQQPVSELLHVIEYAAFEKMKAQRDDYKICYDFNLEERLELKADLDQAVKERDAANARTEKLRAAVNRVVLMGMGEKAYTKDFTTEANGILRAALAAYDKGEG